MTILLLYTTNSGGTQRVSGIISEILSSAGHQVTVKRVNTADPSEIDSYDMLMLGSPSWDYHGKEGQTHEQMRDFLEKAHAVDLSSKKVAVFGLGDTSYMYFTGAVTIMEQFVHDHKGSLLIPSLRIDGFYFDQENNEQKVREWTGELAKAVSI